MSQVESLTACIDSMEEGYEAEAEASHRDLKAQLALVEDERDGQAQRLRFLGEKGGRGWRMRGTGRPRGFDFLVRGEPGGREGA